jgi:hypothetical protein
MPPPARPLDASDNLKGNGVTVGEFWAWAYSDLRSNTVRGVFAEFLVAQAVGAEQKVRDAWDAFDVLSPAGKRIEVKSSAYLQTWPQDGLSTIRFSGLTAYTVEPGSTEHSAQKEVQADLFVFALQACTAHDDYDMLDLSQWQFWAATADQVRASGQDSVGLTWVETNAAGPVAYDALPVLIEDVRA